MRSDNIKVSIILPIYNVGEYFSDCMNSILNQLHRNIEIILVDDGSTDDSGQQADAFALRDERVRVIHKTNAELVQ
jgi:glycosyltransferase involved in cell wall biosynthesis